MSVKIDPSGRRSVQVEVEVPGTPEEIWDVIATGPGVTALFVPAEMDGKVGRQCTHHFGPGFDSVSTIKEWDPPRRLMAEGSMGPDSPPMATEWIVEARGGGKCVVRVVHSMFASSADWDDQLTGTETGWPSFFKILRMYLEHYRGLPCHPVLAVGMSTDAKAWEKLASTLGLSGLKDGARWSSPVGVPPTAGTIAQAIGEKDGVILKLDSPAPGSALLTACEMGGMTVITAVLYLYGPVAAKVSKQAQDEWQTWLTGQFPAA